MAAAAHAQAADARKSRWHDGHDDEALLVAVEVAVAAAVAVVTLLALRRGR